MHFGSYVCIQTFGLFQRLEGFTFYLFFLSNQDALSRPAVIVTLPLTMRARIGALFNLELL